MIRVKQTDNENCEVSGFYDGTEIICLDSNDGKWTITLQSSFSREVSKAREQLEIVNMTFAKADEISRNGIEASMP